MSHFTKIANGRSFLIFFLVLLGASATLLAGTTGKIAGKVVDKTTGQSLVGVNVLIVGTTMGASTDLNGDYSILNVPPGSHVLRASMVGYTTLQITGVVVNIDLTTTVNVQLEEENVKVSEVVIVAQQPMIKKDVSAATANISSEEISSLPVTSVSQVIGLQAGVEGGLVIRGGDANQALFLLNGFAQRDPRNNQPLTEVPLSAIQDISLVKGGFNAEYGQVRSGILNIVTKDGPKDRYEATVTYKYSAPHNKYFGISPYDPGSYWLRPYLDPAVASTGTQNGSWDFYTQQQYPTFVGWNAISKQLMTDDNLSNDLSPAGAQRLFEWQHRRPEPTNIPDYNVDAGFGGPVPLAGRLLGNMRFFLSFVANRQALLVPLTKNDYFDYNGDLKLTSDITPTMKFSLTAVQGQTNNIAANFGQLGTVAGSNSQFGNQLANYETYISSPDQIANDIQYNVTDMATRIFSDAYYSLANVSHYGVSAELTHSPSSSMYYQVSVSYFGTRYQTDPTYARNDLSLYEIFPGYYTTVAPFGYSTVPGVGIGDPSLLLGGQVSMMRDSTRASFLTAKFDLTDQITFNHQIKSGLELDYNWLNLNYGSYVPAFPYADSWVKANYYPIRAAYYLQDKIEYNGFVANVGVRLDYSNSRTDWADVNAFDVSYFSGSYNPDAKYSTSPPKGILTVSPRLGISHPITESSKLYFNYGQFSELPSYELLFDQLRGAGNQMNTFGDPNLPPAKTTSYELGYDQELFSDFLFQASGFYRNIYHQLSSTRYVSSDGTVSYLGVGDNNYEDIMGFEMDLRKSAGRWVTGFASYTYQISSQGRFGYDVYYQNPSDQRLYEQNVTNFSQLQPIPTPWANLVLTFKTPDDYGPKVVNNNILGDWDLTFIGNWRAGGYVTWAPSNSRVINNVKAVDYWNLDMRISKAFDMGPVQLTFLLDAGNLLNLKRFSGEGFSDFEDFRNYMNSLHLPKSNAYTNIPGSDKYGACPTRGSTFHPIAQTGDITMLTNPGSQYTQAWAVYDNTTGIYWQWKNGGWQRANSGQVQQVLDDRSYIDMPNLTTFNFLNPRYIYFGLKLSVNL